MKTNFSAEVAIQVFDTLQERTKCWENVHVEDVSTGAYYMTIRVTQDKGYISQPVMQKVIEVCDSFEMIYGFGCGCTFEVKDFKPICKVNVQIKSIDVAL